MKLGVFVLSLLLSLNVSAQDQVKTEEVEGTKSRITFDINQAKIRKSLVAFPPLQFVGSPSASKNFEAVGGEVYRVIMNDLNVSTFFQFIAQSAFLENTAKTSVRPQSASEPSGFKFETWKQIGAEFLVRGQYALAGDDLTLEAYVYHVGRGTLVLGRKYKGTRSSARKIAHTFSNDFMEALTGKKGMFLSRVTVASDRGGKKFREIYVMDWDGYDTEAITNHKSVALSPAWSPDASKVAYTAMVQRKKTKTRNSDLFIYDLKQRRRWLVSYRQGINSGANFAPNGQHIFLTISQGGTPDIFRMGLEGDLVTQITKGPRGAMNVEPAASPDGTKIAFSSDRSGAPMIYVMNADGSNVRRLTFAGKYNASPAWSPDGSKIAFAGWENDHFDIFVMDADGTNMVRITSAKKPNGKWSKNEDPVFSPDGRLLMYTSDRTGNSQIYISNLDGSEERRITNDSHNYFKPKWSINVE